jgi:DNA-directed RNA polymerase subunit omega
MAEERKTMMEPPIEDLLSKVDSKFTLVTLAAKRGRQINAYFSQLGEGLGSVVPPQVTSVSRKPLSIALEEVAAGKIVSVRLDPTESGAESAAPADEAAAPTSSDDEPAA